LHIKTAFFDLDGTLTDSSEGITNSVAYALRRKGIPVPDRRELYRFIGPPLADEMMEVYCVSRDEAVEMVGWFREYFEDRGIFENRLYGGIAEMLARLRENGWRLAVATSKPEPFAEIILEHFGIRSYFGTVAGSTMDESRASKEAVLTYALEKAGARGEESVMVGDRKHDMLGAKKSGIAALGVLYGYGSREELTMAGADALAESVPDVADLLIRRF